MKPLLFARGVVLRSLALLSFSVSAASAVELTTFGSSVAPTFTVDDSDFTTLTQNAGSILLSGTEGQFFNGTFATVDITGSSALLSLTGNVTTNNTTAFNVTLFDEVSATALYQGGQFTVLKAAGVATIAFTSADDGFDFSKVMGLQFDTVGGQSLIFELSSIEAIPEPSSVFLIVSGAAALLVRRSRAARTVLG